MGEFQRATYSGGLLPINALGSANGFCTAAMSSAVVRAGRIARRAADRLNRSPAPLRIAAPAAAARDAAEESRRGASCDAGRGLGDVRNWRQCSLLARCPRRDLS